MGAERTLSSDELEQLLLRRRRQEAVEGLRLLSPHPVEGGSSAEEDSKVISGAIRPTASTSAGKVATVSTSAKKGNSGAAAPTDSESDIWPPYSQARLASANARRRRPISPIAKALKKVLGKIIDGLVVVAIVLFVITLGVWLWDNYLQPHIFGTEGTTVQAQGGSSPQLGYLSPPEEEIPQAPLPFVTYSSTVTLENAYVPVPTPAPGTVRPNRLVIPRIQLDTPVIEVTVENGIWQVAEYAAGYHRGTARPGTVGNTIISGHKGLKGAVFRRLEELSPGDEVLVYAGPRLYRYIVKESIRVWPYQVEVMAQTSNPIMTLITCTTYDTQRLIVVAHFDREVATGAETGP
jgi:sortase A